MKILDWLADLIPERYKIGIAIKKVALLVGKLAASYVFAKLVTNGTITAEISTQWQLAVAGMTAATLEAVHDWAKLKWPTVPFL